MRFKCRCTLVEGVCSDHLPGCLLETGWDPDLLHVHIHQLPRHQAPDSAATMTPEPKALHSPTICREGFCWQHGLSELQAHERPPESKQFLKVKFISE